MSKEDKERYAWYKEHHICVNCGRNNAVSNNNLCLQCKFKHINVVKKWQDVNNKKHTEYQKQYQQNLRAYRKANGLCQQCGKPSDGKAFCKIHAFVRNEKAKARRYEKGALPRYMMGKGEYCYFCGKPVANKGDKTCPKCHERECKWSEEMRKRIDYDNHIWRKFNDVVFRKRDKQE